MRREVSAPERARSSPCLKCRWSPATEPHTTRHGIVTAYVLCPHACLGAITATPQSCGNASPVWIPSHHFVPLPKPTRMKTTLDPHASRACVKAEAEAGRGPVSTVLFCHRVVPAGTCACLQWMRAGLRSEWDDAAVPREQLRSAWQGSWRTPPERPARISDWALSGNSHSSWHHCHEYQASRWLLQASEREPLCSNLHTFTCNHYAPKMCAASTSAGNGKAQADPGGVTPKMGLQSGPESVPHNGSTNSWWNHKRGRILGAIGSLCLGPVQVQGP